MTDIDKLFIGGEWVNPSSGARSSVTNPSTEKIIGSVLTVIEYKDDDEAVRIANDSDYGLGGTVWTTDHSRGEAIARRVRTGAIGINRFLPDPAAPFGGVKASGVGRELGPEGLDGYLEYRSIYL